MRKSSVVVATIVLVLVLSISFCNFFVVSGEEIPTRGNGTDEYSRWLQFRGNLNNTGYSSSSVPATNDDFLEFQTFSQVRSSAVYANGMIYFGSQGRTVYAVAASNGTLMWSNETGSRVESTPLYHEDTLYVTSADSYLYAFNATTGEFLWRFKTDDEIISS
ncbi:MAG: PQQ-binding-like beta-propeller repeat protein, partial [Methanobacteriota archaeon]